MSVKVCRTCGGVGMVLLYKAAGDAIQIAGISSPPRQAGHYLITRDSVVAGDELDPRERDHSAARGQIIEQDGGANMVNLEGDDLTNAALQTITVKDGLLRVIPEGILTQDVVIRISSAGIVPGIPPILIVRFDVGPYSVRVLDDASGIEMTSMPPGQQWTLWAGWSQRLVRWRKISEAQHS